MLFTGHSEHSIDPKGRLAIPAKYRNEWDETRDGKGWFVLPWPTGHLRLYTENSFKELASRQEKTLTPTEDEADVQSQLFGFAERLEMDSAGRVILPRTHMELACIAGSVVVVGALDRLEVHDRTRWQATSMEKFKRLPELIARSKARTPNSGA